MCFVDIGEVDNQHCLNVLFISKIECTSIISVHVFKYLPFTYLTASRGAIYARWGRPDCPSNGTTLVYTGMNDSIVFKIQILRTTFSTKSYAIGFDLLLLWMLLPSNFKDENIF